jgi:hypothetical protein
VSKRSGALRRAVAGGGVSEPAHSAELARLGGDAREVDPISEIALPRDHPKWARDRFTVSGATKALIDRVKPIAIRVFGFWDHRVHRLALDRVTIEIDAGGSYRCDSPPLALEKRAL